MFDRLLRSGRVASVLALALANAARANTYIVGPGAGADFPDIPSAILGSQPGDVLLVRAATYSGGFTLDKGLTIIGYGSVQLSGAAQVTNIPAVQRATIVHLSPVGVAVDHCVGPVIFQEIESSGAMTITTCRDVRLLMVTASPPPLPPAAALRIAGSRVEIVDSRLAGSDASQAPGYGSEDGGAAIACQPGCRVHFARSIAIGGGGRDNTGHGAHAGDGAPGIIAPGIIELTIAGGGLGVVHAGYGGVNFDPLGDCCYDGAGAPGVLETGGSYIWYSGADIRSTPNILNCTACSTWDPGALCCGGNDVLISPEDPTLHLVGDLTPLTTANLNLNGPVGAHAFLDIGRSLALAPDPHTRIERLVAAARTFDLGVIPASGTISFALYDPAWPPGTFLAAQATLRISAGNTTRTNSVPMVFR